MPGGLFREPEGLTSLEGILERIVFANEENAWTVVRLRVPGRREPVTATGNLLGAQPGESLRLTGRWITDRKHGEQFKAEAYVTVQPATIVGIRKYLGSGLVRGVGPGLAKRLVERFGLATLDVIDDDSGRLTEVEGIGPVRSARIREAWAEQRGIKDVMIFLQSHGVSTGFAVKIYKQYGDRAISIVKEDPYRLAVDIFGIGFLTADRIAASLGVPRDSPRRAAAGILHVLGESSDEGHVFLPRGLLLQRASKMLEIDAALLEGATGDLAREGRIVVAAEITFRNGEGSVADMEVPHAAGDDAAVYLRSLHAAETGAAALLHGLLAVGARPIAIDIERAITWFESRERIELAARQREALRRAASSKILVLTGGPGTGKTTLVNAIIRILEKKGRRILLAAPTGRAAKRMEEATGREAKTIHRLLEFSPKTGRFQKDRSSPLACDLLVLDEVSMLDTVLLFDLLKAMPPRAQLVLVGDVDQIPSVGPGNVLSDLIRSGAVEVVRLTEIFRQAERSQIVVAAHRVNRGEMPFIGGSADPDSDFFFVERRTPEETLAAIKTLVTERIPKRLGVDPVDDIQVLTPMHRGLLGATSLNAELQSLLNPHGTLFNRGSRQFRAGDKVMQIRNNYDLDVYNGDIGRIERIDPIERRVTVRIDDRAVSFDEAHLDELVLAYACSIHKAQGSEYPCVVIPLDTQHYVMLQRNLLYTGITRGRRLVVLVGSRRALGVAVRNARVRARFTALASRLSGKPDAEGGPPRWPGRGADSI